jgi:hypothetical protein
MTDANPAANQAFEGRPDKSKFEENLKSRPTWLRLLFMVFFAIAFNVAALVGTLIVVTGFLFVLLTGEPNQKLKRAGQVLATYLGDIVSYLTYNTDTRPFPFDTDLDRDE